MLSILREALNSDIDLVYMWANDEETRKNSFCTDKIVYNDHINWYKEILNNKKKKLFIYEVNNVPIGQCRIDIDDKVAYISYSIDCNYRGKGHGNVIIKMLIEKVIDDFPNVNVLIAKTKLNNVVSEKVFKKMDFIQRDMEAYKIWELKIR